MPIFLAFALTIPAVTVDLNSNGDPIANTHSPICNLLEFPKLEKGRLVIIKKCEINWCKIETDNYIGWIETKNVWGI